MEQKLAVAKDMVEIGLNFLVAFCLETLACAVFFPEGAPLYALLLPILYPILFYMYRKWLENSLLLFTVAHLAVAMALFWIAGYLPMPVFWRAVYLITGAVYTVRSFRVRVTSERDAEGEIGPMGAAFFALLSFFLCGYVGQEQKCRTIIGICFAWILGYLLKEYLRNFIRYLALNRNSAGVLPKQSIFRMGMLSAGAYSVFSVVVLILCTRTSLVGALTAGIRRILLGVLRVIVWILALFGRGGDPVTTAQNAPQANNEMMLLSEPAEASIWAKILEQVLIAAVMLLMLAGIVFLTAALIRFLIRGFYGREKKKQKIVSAGYMEEQERLDGGPRMRKKSLPVVGGPPQIRVRRIFRRTVLRTVPGQETLQLKTAGELAGPSDQWEGLLKLYERARYSADRISREEAREADKLSRQILHSIK